MARFSAWIAAAVFAASVGIAGAFGGCAQGTTLTSSGTGGSGAGTTSPGGGGSGTWIGQPCATADDCPEGGRCVEIAGEKVCTQGCPPECPDGSYCTLIEGDPVCVLDPGSQCGQCQGSAQCQGLTDDCLTAPAGDRFCARDCTALDDCPSGFVCMAKSDYLAMQAGGGSGGGGSGGGAGSGAGGGPSLPDAGAKPPSGTPFKFCVPAEGASCPCDEKRDGVARSCDIENAAGLCPGSETCDGMAAQWVGCTAKTPVAETCNGEDDDCNGSSDEADPDVMCGGAPPNGSYACNGGVCALGACNPGWTQYPPATPADGCTCTVDASEPNDTCGAAASAGAVSDNGGPVQISGTLSSDADVDVWMIDTVDTDEVTTNSYHVSIDLVVGAGSEHLLLDVIRGDACTDAPGGPATGIVAYDWCVDGKSADGLAGEAPCSIDGPVHCNDNSAKYFVRVYKKAGAPALCISYKVQISAKGGDPCDFAAKCQ